MNPNKLYPHQEQALESLSNGKILWGGVGSGKTRISAEYYVKREKPKDVYVITTARKRDSLDWEGEFAWYAIGKTPESTVGGILTVDSWNNIAKYRDVENAFFIFDEQRLVGNGAWVQAFLDIAKQNRWILLTATPGDNWIDYIPVFLANGYFRNRTEFISEHVIYNHYGKFPKVDRYVGVGKLVRLRHNLLVHVPYKPHTTRHIKTIFVKHNQEAMRKVMKDRWNIYEDRPLRNITEMFWAMRKVANSDESRLSALEQLMTKHDKLILFYNFDYELRILEDFLTRKNATFTQWNGHLHEPIPTTDEWVYLVQYVAGAEAWNCVETDAMVFYSMNYSYKIFEQAMGRIDRMNTPFRDLYYYVLSSRTAIDGSIKKALDQKRSFNEAEMARKSHLEL